MATGLKDAEIVIVGGGIVGLSVAYHLTRLGKKDVLLIEKGTLTSGSTWHAAGNIGQLRTSANLTRLVSMSVALYRRLEAETGVAPDWREVGSLRIASSEERWRELRQAATMARIFGLEVELVSPAEAKRLYPLISLDGVVGGAFTPSDGYIQPAGVAMALAKGARSRGARIVERVRVTGFVRKGRRIAEVKTEEGAIRCDLVVNAAGMWARPVGRMAGADVPVAALENQYIVTEPIEGMPKNLPVIRDNDNYLYARPEVGGLLVGAVDKENPAFGVGGVPWDFERQLLPEDWERFEPAYRLIARRLPVLDEVGVRSFVNGPLPMTPDGEPIMGYAPGLENFFLACGFVAGIGQGGGAGEAMAEWIVAGRPPFDLWRHDCRRLSPLEASENYVYTAAQDAFARHYDIHFPGEEHPVGVGARQSPLHDRLKERRAVFGMKFGWSRPNWFAPEGMTPTERASYGRPNWFLPVGEEHRAVRERAGLADRTSRGKFLLSGPKALDALQRLVAADCAVAPGRIVRGLLLNEAGGIEADLVVARLAEDRFYIVTGAATTRRDFDWLVRRLPEAGATLADVSTANAAILVAGPKARELLAEIAETDISDSALPHHGCKAIEAGYADALALRYSDLGELAYELHLPVEQALSVYDRLGAAGAALGAANVGHRALDSLRIEKAVPMWGPDLTPDVTPLDAGLESRIAWAKGDFTGKRALEALRAKGTEWRFAVFTLDEDRPAFGGEALVLNGAIAGQVTSAHYGYTVGRPVLLGYVRADAAGAQDGWQIEAFAERFPAERLTAAPYDPKDARLLA